MLKFHMWVKNKKGQVDKDLFIQVAFFTTKKDVISVYNE